jgi:hypothetical protein
VNVNFLGKLRALFHGVDVIEQLARQALVDNKLDAVEALHFIAGLIDTLRSGFADKLTVEAVEAEIKNLHKAMLGNDVAADKALDDKFDTPKE